MYGKSTSCSLLLIKMGMMSRAMVGVVPERDAIRFEQFRKQEQEIMRKKPELRNQSQPKDEQIHIDADIILSLERMAAERGIDVNDLVNTRLRAMVYSFENGRELGLNDPMPFGMYRGTPVEQMIRSDPRYVRWLHGESEIFQLNEPARRLLEELS